MDYDPKHQLLQRNDQAFKKLFNVESEFMAAQGYSDNADKVRLRGLLVTIIDKLSQCSKFDAFIPYLAVNYLDRILSRKQIVSEIPNKSLKLFATCCLTLAWKMKSKKFRVSEFMRRHKLGTNLLQIRMMELQILNELKWQMRSLTGICFMEYFYPFFKLGHPQPKEGFTRRDISQTIITVQGDIRFTEFKPSIIAASAVLSASFTAFPAQFLQRTEAVLRCQYIDKDALLLCMEAMGIEVLEDVKALKESIKIEEAKKIEEGKEINNNGKRKVNDGPELKRPEAKKSRKAANEDDDDERSEEEEEEEEEEIVMNFALNWPVAELEGGLNIPYPDPNPNPNMGPLFLL